jgi:magnesium transporter
MRGLGRIVACTPVCLRVVGRGAEATPGWSARGHPFLIEYEEQLSSRVQFVLDAWSGLIGIAQNDVFKVLTIV